MARTFSAGQRTAIQGNADHYVKLELKDSAGSWTDVSDLGDYDFLQSFTLEEDIDSNTMSMAASLLREAAATVSLAPLLGTSSLNSPGPMLDVSRQWRTSVAIMPSGTAPSGGDYVPLGEGTYDVIDVNDPSPTIDLVGRDLGATLLDTYITTERTYSSASSDSMETVIQAMLDDNLGASAITLYTPTSPAFTMRKWVQQKENLMVAINKVARLAGFVCKYRYDAADVLRLTLYAPDRAASTEDWEIGPDEYTAVPMHRIDLSGVRNSIKVTYRDSSTGSVSTVTRSDATSISNYGGPLAITRYMEVDMSLESQIDTSARADALGDAILADLKDPEVQQVFQAPGFWIAQLGDYGKFSANDVHSDSDQYGGVTHVRHELANGRMMTTLSVRGQPAGKYKTWIADAALAADLPTAQGTVAIKSDGSVEVAIDGPDWVGSYKYSTSTSAFPTLATVRASGTSADGRQVTFSLAASTLALGSTIYISAIPYSVAGAKGYEGPSIQMKATRHDATATKTVYFGANSLTVYDPAFAANLKFSGGYAYALSCTAINNLQIPSGVTITGMDADLYSGTSGTLVSRCKLELFRTDSTGGTTSIGSLDSLNHAGWENKTFSSSESTTNRQYQVRVSFVNDNLGGTDTDQRISRYAVTYTMPSTANQL